MPEPRARFYRVRFCGMAVGRPRMPDKWRMREISPQEAQSQHGVDAIHHEMDNGELRFRLRSASGPSYALTRAGPKGAWQQSHFHAVAHETYIVECGWIAFATRAAEQAKIEVFEAGEIFTTAPGVVHTIYMPANAVMHTIKHGASAADDRSTSAESVALDAYVAAFAGEDAIRAANARKA
jgi:hypothetical protein